MERVHVLESIDLKIPELVKNVLDNQKDLDSCLRTLARTFRLYITQDRGRIQAPVLSREYQCAWKLSIMQFQGSAIKA